MAPRTPHSIQAETPLIMLFQLPGMSYEQFTQDASMVEADLLTLKSVLEGHTP